MPTTALTTADWISRDDMATLVRKSTDTVVRDCTKHGLPTQTDAESRVLVNVGDFLRIGRLRPEDLTLGATPAESAEVLRARDTITALKTQSAELRGRLGQADTLVDTLREQLTIKDRQLSKHADHITQLIASLARLGSTA